MKQKSSLPTVADVARLAGVGAITVSRYVNRTSYISEEKKRKIQAAIDRLGYRPNQAARILTGHRARIIGLIVPDLGDCFFAKCAAAVEAYAASFGYMTLAMTAKKNREQQQKEIAGLIGQHIAGVIVVPTLPQDILHQLADSKMPVVAFDLPYPGTNTDEVLVENLRGAQTAVEHLAGHGHKRIACVGSDKNSYTMSQRILGYQHAMQQAKLKPEVYDRLATAEDAWKLVSSWKTAKQRPTAVFSLSHIATRHILSALQGMHISVPQSMAVAGFDDFDLAPLLFPSLTVVRQPAFDLGTQAARLLFDRINAAKSTEAGFGIKLVLPVEFVIRNSCGCPVKKQA